MDLDKMWWLEEVSECGRKGAKLGWVLLFNQRWCGAGRQEGSLHKKLLRCLEASAALLCFCVVEGACLFFPWAWWDRPAAVGWGRSRLIFALCIRSWFIHRFASLSFLLPTWCSGSEPGRIALKQLIKDCSLNQSQTWLHLVQDKTDSSLS